MPEKRKKKSAAKKSNSLCSVESYKNKIVTFLKAYGKKLMPLSELESKCRTKNKAEIILSPPLTNCVQKALSL